MKNIVVAFLVLLFVSSCTFHQPVYRGGESVKMGGLDGRELKITVDANVFNENKFAVTVKPSDLDVYIEDEYIGKVHLDKKFKMKGNSETRITAPMTITIAEGALFKAMRLANQKNLKIRLKGKVKAGAFLISKKFEVNEEKTIKGLKLGL